MNRSLMPNASCFSIAISIIMLIAATSTAQELNRPPENFQALFNGIDTTGWYGWATKNPEKLWAMSDEEQAQYKKESRCLLYTSPSPRDLSTSRMPSSA